MKLLVTGSGKSGSWIVRGEQMGAALGALVKPHATLADMGAADVILVVKRCTPELLAGLQICGRPWVFDVVDPYPQPACNSWSPYESIAWLQTLIQRLRPNAVVWPTERMREDGGGIGKVIRHHHRPGIERNPIRERIEVVGYEGSARYLDGGLLEAITDECHRRGARFVVNPAQLAELDVVVALRSARWTSYAARHWKSGVKLSNAHASGTPFIGARECGYIESATGGEEWATTASDVGAALDALAPRAVRQAISERFVAATFPVERAAAQIREVLCALKS
jgi:hypothetical protein